MTYLSINQSVQFIVGYFDNAIVGYFDNDLYVLDHQTEMHASHHLKLFVNRFALNQRSNEEG